MDQRNETKKIFSAVKRTGSIAWTVFKFFLNRPLAFAALCALAVVLFTARDAHRIGISFFPKTTEISVSSLYYQQGMDCWAEGDYIRAEENLLLALEEVRREKSDAELETAEVMQKLGALYLSKRQYSKSYELLTSAYVAFRNKLGFQDGMTILAMGQLAACDLATGYEERALATLSDAYDQTDNMRYKMEIAQLIVQAYTKLGDYQRADGFYQLLFQFYEGLDVVNAAVVNLWNDYGIMLLEQGEHEKALSALKTAESYWESLSAQEKDNNPEVLSNIYGNEASVYAYLNRSQEAEEYLDQVFKINESFGGSGSTEIASAYLTKANVCEVLGKREDCLNALEQSLSAALDSAGENSALTASVYRALGAYHSKEGALDLAIEYDKKVLEIERNILAEQEYGTALAYQVLCADYNAAGDYERGIEHGLKAVEICEERFQRDNPLTGKAYAQVSWPYLNSGDFETARFYAELASDICDRHLPKIDAGRADAHLVLAHVYEKLEKFPECFEEYQQAIELYRASFGEDCFSIADVEQALGDAYLISGDYQSAEEAYQSALSIFLQLEEHYDERIVRINNSLGLSAYHSGDFERALEQYANAEAVCKKALQENESDKDLWELLASVYNNIAAVCEKQERYENAAEFEFKTYGILTANSLDYRNEDRIAQRIDHLHQRLAPQVPLETWLREGSEKNDDR